MASLERAAGADGRLSRRSGERDEERLEGGRCNGETADDTVHRPPSTGPRG